MVDPTSGASAAIAGVSVPNIDGILLEAGRLWAVQNSSNQVSRCRLSPGLTSGVVEKVISSDQSRNRHRRVCPSCRGEGACAA